MKLYPLTISDINCKDSLAQYLIIVVSMVSCVLNEEKVKEDTLVLLLRFNMDVWGPGPSSAMELVQRLTGLNY